ncbi:MAG TPA: GntR family transcriptional regulator [Clostridia bacterium]|nr:GntR family transcriptional regulator [Clostridia bacterium]
MYEQITEQIKGLILSGALSPGDTLPSMRFLAKELRISVITTKRAYTDLERDGFLVTVMGKGTFVADKNVDFLREEKLRQIDRHLQAAIDTAREAGVPLRELTQALETLYKGE